MHSTLQKVFLGVGAILSLTGTGVCAYGKDSIVIGVTGELDTLNPIVGATVANEMVRSPAIRRVISLDLDNKVYSPVLREVPSFEKKTLSYVKNSTGGKGLKIDVEFLPDLQWADGEPVTCDDLKFSWEVGLNPNVSVASRDNYTDIVSIDLDPKNSRKCSLVMKKAVWQWYLNLPDLISAHVERAIFEKYKSTSQAYERNSAYQTNPANPGLWFGPFRITEYKIGSHVSLVPNEHWHGTKPFFKKIIYKFVQNATALESNLLSGNIDMIAPSGMSLDLALAFEKKVKAQNLPYRVSMRTSFTFSFWDVNLDHPILKDKMVRQALYTAINRDEINKAFYENHYKTAASFVHPEDSWFTTNPKQITIYPSDKKKAAEILDQAGWKVGPDGIRAKNGQKMTFTVTAAAEYKINENIEVFVKNSWKAIGVDLQIKNIPARVMFSENLPHRQFDFIFFSFSGAPDSDSRTSLHSSFIPSEKNSYSGQNNSGWINPEVDNILDQEELEFDPKTRTSLMRKLMKLYTEELPQFPFYHRVVVSIIPASMKGYRNASSQYSEFNHIEDWKWE